MARNAKPSTSNKGYKAQAAILSTDNQEVATNTSKALKYSNIPVQLAILARYSYKLLTGNTKTLRRPRHTPKQHHISQLKTKQDMDREVGSLKKHIETFRKKHHSKLGSPHEIASKFLERREKFK